MSARRLSPWMMRLPSGGGARPPSKASLPPPPVNIVNGARVGGVGDDGLGRVRDEGPVGDGEVVGVDVLLALEFQFRHNGAHYSERCARRQVPARLVGAQELRTGWERDMLQRSMSVDPEQYAALAERAGFADRSACGRLRITGADALDLLNRLTTNDLSSLPDGAARSTVLTNGDARVIDHLRLAAAGGVIWCVASPGRADAVIEWIDRYTFSEDIAVEDVSSVTAHLAIAGPLAGGAVGAAGLPAPPLDEVGLLGGAVVIASAFGAHPVYDVILPLADAERAAAALRASAEEADAAAFDAYRIAQGVPAYGAEFGAFNNPLEARLLGSISDKSTQSSW